jgi:hypothetical protein
LRGKGRGGAVVRRCSLKPGYCRLPAHQAHSRAYEPNALASLDIDAATLACSAFFRRFD